MRYSPSCYNILFFLICFLLLANGASATISGPASVSNGGTDTYSYNDGTIISPASWNVTNGDIVNYYSSGTTYYVIINWLTTGSAVIQFKENGSTIDSKSVTVAACTTPVPTTSGSWTVCGGSSVAVSLNAVPGSGGTGVNWYSALAGGSLLFSGTTYSPTITGTTTYYLATTGAACESSRTAKTITVNQQPQNPPFSGVAGSRCGPGTVSISATKGSDGEFLWWYTTATGGNHFYSSNTTLTLDNLTSTTTYYASTANSNGCDSPSRLAIAATIKTIPNAAASNQTICSGQSTSISITNPNGVSGTTFSWTVSPSAVSGFSSGSGSTVSQTLFALSNVQGTVTYSITPTANSCAGTPITVTATVKPVPDVAAVGQGIYSGEVTAIPITNPNAVSGTTFSWTQASSNVSGAINGAGSNIAQTLSSAINGNVVYTITPVAGSCPGQSLTVTVLVGNNSVHENIILIDSVATSSAVDALPIGSKSQLIHYFDGIGRSAQTINTKGSPSLQDVVKPIVYDDFGREAKKYAPFVSTQNTGFYNSKSTLNGSNYTGSTHYNFYNNSSDKIADDAKPFSETKYESSPLNRIIKQGAMGTPWQPDANLSYSSTDATIKYSYQLDTANEVLKWTFTKPTTISPLGIVNAGTASNPIYYDARILRRNRTKDERLNEVIEYLDTEGHVVLKRVQAVAGSLTIDNVNYASTYYIYDDMGELVCVIPPEATSKLSTEYFQSGATNATKEAFMNRWAFRYKYDQRKRLVLKQVPGADSVRIVYDIRDRLMFTQDGNQRAGNKWSYTEYDGLNRPIITGVYTHGSSITQMGMASLVNGLTNLYETYNGIGSMHGYTNTVFSSSTFNASGFEVQSVSYYDDYSFKTMIADSQFDYVNNDYADQFNLSSGSNPNVRGLLIGHKVKILDQSTYLWTVSYLDDKNRTVQSITHNVKGGVDRTTSVLDFVGKTMKTMTTHKVGSVTHTIARHMDYDEAGRLVKTWHKTDIQPDILLVQNEYNGIGQLVTKKLHAQVDKDINKNTTTYSLSDITVTNYGGQAMIIARNSVTLDPGFDTGVDVDLNIRIEYTPSNPPPGGVAYVFAQVIDYRYNIRGWLTAINNSDLSSGTSGDPKDYFGMELGYNTDIGTGASVLYNGNISAITWSTDQGQSLLKQRAYNYQYDAMNRINGATQKEKMTTWASSSNFSETGYDYDLNGNIKGLTRNGGAGTNIDVLTYDYGTTKSNQLLKVSDTADKTKGFIEPSSTTGNDYSYDTNGNMITDQNKGITAIAYNQLNLPKQVTKSANDYIKYVYDAGGRKIRQEVYNASNTLLKKTEYDGEYTYENDTLKFINAEEGRVIMTGTKPEYQYYLKDHLGNIRLTFSTKLEKDVDAATLEAANLTSEQSKFLRYAHAKKVNSTIFDHTNGPSTGYSQRLNGSTNEKYGIARSLSVMTGDTIKLEVYGKYVDSNTANWTGAFNTLMGQIASNTVGVVVEGGSYSTSTSSFSYIVGLGDGRGTGGPKAYLNWLVFDRDFNPITALNGYKRMSAAPGEHGQDVVHEKLTSPDIIITQPGYVYVYLSNEETSPLEVYFDDFKVTHAKMPVIQTDDYYPFGLTFNSYSRENSFKNNSLYQGKEWQNELDLNLYDFEWRQYDPTILRTLTIDPHSENYYAYCPYSWAGNNPVMMIDPDGRDWYKNGETGAVMWQKGSASVDGYENIGATYSYRQGDVTYTYNQNDVSTIEEHVLEPNEWVTDQRKDALGNKVECFIAAKEMADKTGSETQMGGQIVSIVTGEEVNEGESHALKSTGKNAEASNYINSQIDNGNSVVLGVDYKKGSPNNDKATDHFVALSSRITDIQTGKQSYRFYDPGTKWRDKGTHSSNIMSFNKAGLLSGKTFYSGMTLTTSQVRKNK